MAMRILMLAGEQSGVFYAERIKSEIRSAAQCEVEFRGYEDYGFKVSDLAVMGIGPVLRKLFYFMRVARTMKRAIREWRPDAVVTIDYPGMNLKLAAYAKGVDVPAVHVVCPQVWAWHRGRVPKIAASLTRLLCFLPFEPAIFPPTPGFKATFIGIRSWTCLRRRGEGPDARPWTLRAPEARKRSWRSFRARARARWSAYCRVSSLRRRS